MLLLSLLHAAPVFAGCAYELLPKKITIRNEIDPTKAEGNELEMFVYSAVYGDRMRLLHRGPGAKKTVPRSQVGAPLNFEGNELFDRRFFSVPGGHAQLHLWVYDADAGVMPSENPSGWWSDLYIDEYVLSLDEISFSDEGRFEGVIQNESIEFSFTLLRSGCTA